MHFFDFFYFSSLCLKVCHVALYIATSDKGVYNHDFFIYLYNMYFCNSGSFFPFSSHSSSYYLFRSSDYIIIIIIFIMITIMFINITVTGIVGKSNGGDFQARNSSGMVYPFS